MTAPNYHGLPLSNEEYEYPLGTHYDAKPNISSLQSDSDATMAAELPAKQGQEGYAIKKRFSAENNLTGEEKSRRRKQKSTPPVFWCGSQRNCEPKRLKKEGPFKEKPDKKASSMFRKPHTRELFQKLEEVLKNHFSDEIIDDPAEVFLSCSSWKETAFSSVMYSVSEPGPEPEQEGEVTWEHTREFNLKIRVNSTQ